MMFTKEVIKQIVKNVITGVADPELSETCTFDAWLVTNKEFYKIFDCIAMAIGNDYVVASDVPPMCGFWTIDIFKINGNEYEPITHTIFEMVDE